MFRFRGFFTRFQRFGFQFLNLALIFSLLVPSSAVMASGARVGASQSGISVSKYLLSPETKFNSDYRIPTEVVEIQPVREQPELEANVAEPTSEPVRLASPPPLMLPSTSAEEVREILASHDNSELLVDSIYLSIQALDEANPGGSFRVAWEVEGLQAEGELELIVVLPDGLGWLGDYGRYDERSGILVLPVAESAGMLYFSVADDAKGPFEILVKLTLSGKTIDQAALIVPEAGLHDLSAGGGTIVGLDGLVSVTFPAEAATEDLQVYVRNPVGASRPPMSLSGHPFEVIAREQDSQLDVRQFDQPLSLAVSYDETQLRGEEDTLRLYYYDESSDNWNVLPSQVDIENNILHATTDHLTVFDLNTSGWEEARLPSLQAFQVASFTGAATYEMPLWVPPGPAGLQPSLNLSYNSQVVNSAIPEKTQASWVGMGWSLDTGYIERNMNGTTTNDDDDTFSISAGGVDSMLLQGEDGYYHTTGETYWRVKYDDTNDKWTAWDKSGTKYIFGDTTDTKAEYVSDWGDPSCDLPITHSKSTWRWALHEIVNVHGETLTITYDIDTIQRAHLCGHVGGMRWVYPDMFIYPESIIYPHEAYSVTFTLEDRDDYDSDWDYSTSRLSYQRYRLDNVKINHNGSEIRRYELDYATQATIFPNNTWSAGDPTLALSSVQEIGWNGAISTTLPATTFSYDDLHMDEAENGYDGEVQFDYDSEPWYEIDTTESREYTPGNSCAGSLRRAWMTGYNGGSASCDTDDVLKVTGQAYLEIPEELYQPGGAYQFVVKLKAKNNPITAQVGINDSGTVTILETKTGITKWGYTTLDDARGVLSSNATYGRLHLYCSGTCKVDSASIKLLPTRYRVEEKRIYDGLGGDPGVFEYRYDEAATNDEDHSTAACEDDPYVPNYAEFRGHALTQVLGPDGRVDWTFFHQDDVKRGRASTSIVSVESFNDDFEGESLDTAEWTVNSGTGSLERLLGDGAFKIDSGAFTRNFSGLGNGEAVLTQFMLDEDVTSATASLDSGTMHWGVELTSSDVFKVYGASPNPDPFADLTFERDTWYVLLLVVDDDQMYLRAWERDKPETAAWHQADLTDADD
jgi:hypothetical protein